MKTFTALFESIRSNDREYYDALESYYSGKFQGDREKTDRVMELIKSGDEMAMNYGRSFGSTPEVHVESGDNHNILIKWIDTAKAVFILGIISKSGSIGRQDLRDMNEWIERLIAKVREGKMIYTSVNQSSRLLIDRIKRMLDRDGIEYRVVEQPSLVIDENDPTLTWTNVMLVPKQRTQ